MRVKIALLLKPFIEAKAKERMLSGKADPCLNSVKGSVDTGAEIAKAASVSKDTVRKVEAVLAKGTEEMKSAMLTGQQSIHAAFTKTTEALKERRKP